MERSKERKKERERKKEKETERETSHLANVPVRGYHQKSSTDPPLRILTFRYSDMFNFSNKKSTVPKSYVYETESGPLVCLLIFECESK